MGVFTCDPKHASFSGSSQDNFYKNHLYISTHTRTCEHTIRILLTSRGVQHGHWVMHKCIMVKVGGKRNTHKVCKKPVNFSKTKFVKVGGNNNFREKGGKCTETGKIGERFVICGR